MTELYVDPESRRELTFCKGVSNFTLFFSSLGSDLGGGWKRLRCCSCEFFKLFLLSDSNCDKNSNIFSIHETSKALNLNMLMHALIIYMSYPRQISHTADIMEKYSYLGFFIVYNYMVHCTSSPENTEFSRRTLTPSTVQFLIQIRAWDLKQTTLYLRYTVWTSKNGDKL